MINPNVQCKIYYIPNNAKDIQNIQNRKRKVRGANYIVDKDKDYLDLLQQ